MKPFSVREKIVLCAVLAICLCAAWIPNQKVINFRAYDLTLDNDMAITGDASFGGTLAVTGVTTITSNTTVGGTLFVTGGTITTSTLSIGGVTTFVGERILPPTVVALTSPSLTFSVAGMNSVVLSSDENVTAAYPIGGTLNQGVEISSAASGSNTIQFDDGAKTAIGANVVLTESQLDSITLKCTTAPDVWRGVAAHQN